MRVKICGITHIEDARLCESLGTDFLGFIFEPSSPRFVDYALAKSIIAELTRAKPVGIFVNQSSDEISAQAKELNLAAVQIYHPHLFTDPLFEVIRVLRIKDAQDLLAVASLRKKFPEDYILLDTYHDNQLGGTGQCFDWSLLPKNLERWFLSGGIRPHNVTQALTYHPFAIDLSSGVEACPGRKDKIKIQELMDSIAVRGPVMGFPPSTSLSLRAMEGLHPMPPLLANTSIKK